MKRSLRRSTVQRHFGVVGRQMVFWLPNRPTSFTASFSGRLYSHCRAFLAVVQQAEVSGRGGVAGDLGHAHVTRAGHVDPHTAEWDKRLEPVWDKWSEDLDSRGFKGSETVEKFRELRDEYRNN